MIGGGGFAVDDVAIDDLNGLAISSESPSYSSAVTREG
jgi:hypothetical protein